MRERAEVLRALVETHRTRWLRLQWLQAIGLSVTLVLGSFLAAVAVDHFVRLSMAGRFLLAVGLMAACGGCGRLLYKRWQRGRPSEDEIALAIEQRTPGGVQNRLINALQIGREAESRTSAAGSALVEENWRHLQKRALPGAVPVVPAAVAALSAVALLLAIAAGWIWRPDQFSTAASRILLPFASIDPLYRTTLVVEPGDMEAVGDVPIRVRIRGERPEELALLLESADKRSSVIVPVPAGSDVVTCTIPNVVRNVTYAVRGGDYTSPYYRIEVPAAPRLTRVRSTYHYPEYTKLPPRSLETSGDLEAVNGTKADVVFVLDRPVDAATLIMRAGAGARGTALVEQRLPLKLQESNEAVGEMAFEGTAEYRLETRVGSRPPFLTPWQHVRGVADEPPKVELSGVPTSSEIPLDAPVTLRVTAADDFGLTRAGLFVRRAAGTGEAAEWTKLGEWKSDYSRKATETVEFLASSFGAVEGDRLEISARASDAFPGRKGDWATAPVANVMVVGEGAHLQLVYEQLLRSEAEIAALIASAQKLHQESDTLVRKLDAGTTVDDNTPPRVKEILDWTTDRTKEQNQLRETAARVAREIVPIAGSLRLSLGMLSDTEMIRTVRVLDSVATRDDPRGRRIALTEGRATQQRTLQSLQQIHEQFVKFRHEWELAHMVPFVRMLADRQVALRDQSQQRLDAGQKVSMAQCDASVRRQAKLSELCVIAGSAFTGLAERTQEVEEQLAEAFAATSDGLSAEELKKPMAAAGKAMMSADWAGAVKEQSAAADMLDQIMAALQEAQSAAAKRVIAGLEERSDSDLAAQAALEKLKEGDGEDLLDEPAGLKLTNIIHAKKMEQDKNAAKAEVKPDNYLFPDSAIGMLQQPDSGKRQQFDILKLATAPSGTPSFPQQSDRKGNKVKPHIQEEFEDLVGDLLEEADEMKANYETYNLNAAFNINEPGEIGKQGGDLNSTAAAAATGNMKPPTTNVGGASRVGRQGARAFGAAQGNESINRRGRDKVQEGQERAPDQAGSVKETKSDDPQEDTSTGIGGRKVESDDAKFSQNDAGEFTEDMVGRMEKAKDTHHIVERQGKGISAGLADQMRDMNSKQEQTLERLKSIRKELKNLYLPTDQLDDLIQKMQANLHSLSERPTSEVYQLQQQTLDQLRGALQVFHQAHSGFQASLPREQYVRGRVVDDPSRTAPPGYEDAVRLYYQRLTAR